MANFFENLPKHIRVGPYEDSIETVQSLGKNRGVYSGGCRIRLAAKAHETPQEALDTVVHEVLHSIWDKARIAKGKMTEEVIVSTFASWFAAVLMDNHELLKWIVEVSLDHHDR